MTRGEMMANLANERDISNTNRSRHIPMTKGALSIIISCSLCQVSPANTLPKTEVECFQQTSKDKRTGVEREGVNSRWKVILNGGDTGFLRLSSRTYNINFLQNTTLSFQGRPHEFNQYSVEDEKNSTDSSI